MKDNDLIRGKHIGKKGLDFNITFFEQDQKGLFLQEKAACSDTRLAELIATRNSALLVRVRKMNVFDGFPSALLKH